MSNALAAQLGTLHRFLTGCIESIMCVSNLYHPILVIYQSLFILFLGFLISSSLSVYVVGAAILPCIRQLLYAMAKDDEQSDSH